MLEQTQSTLPDLAAFARIGVVEGDLDFYGCLRAPRDQTMSQDAADAVAGQLAKAGFAARTISPARIAAADEALPPDVGSTPPTADRWCLVPRRVTNRLGVDGLLTVQERVHQSKPGLDFMTALSDMPGTAEDTIRGVLTRRDGVVAWTGTVQSGAIGQSRLLGLVLELLPSLAGPRHQARSQLAAMLAGKVAP